MSTNELERAECPTCNMSVEGPVPATFVCGCGTTLSIHGGELPAAAVERARSSAAAALAAPHGPLGVRDYA
jgi:hypothetical protein